MNDEEKKRGRQREKGRKIYIYGVQNGRFIIFNRMECFFFSFFIVDILFSIIMINSTERDRTITTASQDVQGRCNELLSTTPVLTEQPNLDNNKKQQQQQQQPKKKKCHGNRKEQHKRRRLRHRQQQQMQNNMTNQMAPAIIINNGSQFEQIQV